ncbi:MAG: response regulator transcription factor [Anaerolineae bacterium]
MTTNCAGPIRVLVVDDHPTMRYGLQVFLSAQPDMVCIGEARSGEVAVKMCRDLRPDVVLMDVVMPGMDGPTAIGLIRSEMPEIHLIALTTFSEVALAQKAIRAGASSYLLKTISTEDLAAAVRDAARGRRTFSAEITQALAEAAADDQRPPAPHLSEREMEVLALVAEGKTDAEIAHALNITKSTTRFHLKSIFAKLGASNRTEAVHFASACKLI